MDIKNIIDKKALGKKLTKQEINYFIEGYLNGTITDYQASALLMAIRINGMTENETFALTGAMLNSGIKMDFSDLGLIVDKHSTGGVSDTTTITLVPICMACGVKMFKMSGRGLGHTGGTIDKLESFTGFKADIDIEKAKELVRKNGGCIISATKNLAPADKKIYALRDTTATVESIPLIASSIMSKKLAGGANKIVLDVKYGNGAIIKAKKDAIYLAKLMVKIGENAGAKMDYIIDDMNEPLGYNIGNKLEAYEAIEVLSGKQGKLTNTTLKLAGKCISLGLNIPYEDAVQMAKDAIKSGKALSALKTIVKAQGGSTALFNGLTLKPKLVVTSPFSGTLQKIECARLGSLVGQLGANRQKVTDEIDYNVGVKTFHKLGDKINVGDVLFEIYAKTKAQANEFANEFLDCYKVY